MIFECSARNLRLPDVFIRSIQIRSIILTIVPGQQGLPGRSVSSSWFRSPGTGISQ